MRVDAVVIGWKCEGTNWTLYGVVLGVATVTGCRRLLLLSLFRLVVDRVWNRIGENRMTIGKETTTFSNQSNQAFSACEYHFRRLRNETLPFRASFFLFISKRFYRLLEWLPSNSMFLSFTSCFLATVFHVYVFSWDTSYHKLFFLFNFSFTYHVFIKFNPSLYYYESNVIEKYLNLFRSDQK